VSPILDGKVLKAISCLPSLRILILISCQMESGGLIELLSGDGYVVEGNVFPWRELYLGSNNIGDEGAIALARALKCQNLRSLRVLQLESNVFSVSALKNFVYEGLAYSLRLQSLSIWNVGAHTASQIVAWQEVEKQMEHYLSLNQAGREVLYMDKRKDVDHETLEDVKYQKMILSHLWPILLEEADRAYGANALFYFLSKRPDLILPFQEYDGSPFPCVQVNKLHSPTNSPRGVADKTNVM
jgi:Leucine Rich repeat